MIARFHKSWSHEPERNGLNACSIRALGSLLEVRPVSVLQLGSSPLSADHAEKQALFAGWSETKHGEGTNLPGVKRQKL